MRLLCCVLSLLVTTRVLAETPAPTPKPTTIAELQHQIEKVLKDTRTPGVGLAIVKRDGPEWIAGLGLANIATGEPATADTLFRIGSVSKAFVSLSVLKLQQEGRLSLQDTLKSRAPDLEFTNPWEATDPVRIVHLLEHTSGWDDMAMREYAVTPADDLPLRAGLAFHPKSRTSRWKPGTRFSYSNSGPPAAAYVIERVTGQRFEDYVEQNWFRPLGMKTATYFEPAGAAPRLTQLYHGDGRTPFPYWHILLRPAGSINASARDMARYVQFYLNRGAVDGMPLLPPEAIARIEEPASTYAAREGLKTGYGLGNYATVRARVYHGHNGGVSGGLTDLAYLPDLGVGFVVMINSGSGQALRKIDELVRGYLDRALPKPETPPLAPVAEALVRSYAGWYEPISPRQEFTRAFLRIAGLAKISATKSGLDRRAFAGHPQRYVPVTDHFFRRPQEGAPTLALIADRSEGTLIEINGQTFRRIPGWMPWLEATVCLAAVLLMASTLIFAFVWVPRRLLGHLRGVEGLSVRTMPVIATLALGAMCLALVTAGEDMINRLGRPTPWSVTFFASSWAFLLFSLLGVVLALRFRRRRLHRLVWWHAFTASIVLTIVALYMAYGGLIGLRLWA